jgi:serine protease Do
MNNRTLSMVALMAVIGISIVFGVFLGGKMAAPHTALAASGELKLSPSVGGGPAIKSFADIVEQAMPAVVSVRSTRFADEEEDDDSRSRNPLEFFFGPHGNDEKSFDHRNMPRIGEGSGFFIDPTGYLLTNNHVVEDADRVVIGMEDGREFDARVVGTDPSIDLALLKIDSDEEPFPSLSMGDSGNLRVGEWVLAIGNPLAYEHTVTVGVLSAKNRKVPIGATDIGVVSFLQTDAAINFGNSGGPLIDSNGNVVGINTAITRQNYAEGIGFALPIDHVRMVVEQLRETGRVRRGFIGIAMNPTGIDQSTMEYYGLPDRNGVIVRSVTEGMPAEEAGLLRGDIIRKVDHESVKDNMDLVSKIASHQPDETVDVEVFREGKTLNFEVTLIDRNRDQMARINQTQEMPFHEEPRDSTRLGITVKEIDSSNKRALGLESDQQGLLITDVDYESEASDKGLIPNMVIVAVDGQAITNLSEWNEAIDKLQPGVVMMLDVLAGDRGSYVYLRIPK